VRRTLKKFRGRWLFEDTKNKSSSRTIELPAGTVRILADLERDGELVFTDGLGEPVALRSVVACHFKPILERAGLPQKVRLYDLRHTHATLLLIAGVHPKIVSERLGHSSIQITLDTYSHVLPNMQKDSAAKLDTMLFSSRPRSERDRAMN
jgi:integrase